MFDTSIANELGLLVTLLAFALFWLGASGSGRGWWRHEAGFGLVGLAALCALGALIIVVRGGLVAGIPSGILGVVSGLVAITIGVALVVIPIAFLVKVATTPWIHDITTDFDDPPAIVEAKALRPAHADSVEYPGERVSAIQRVSYPSVVQRTLEMPVVTVFERALDLARANGWRIVSTRPGEGTFEAVVTSRLFGFQDDVVVRVKATGTGSRVDMRSASRVGDTDLGVNADRIVTFLSAL